MTGTDDNAASLEPTLALEVGALDEVSDGTATEESAAVGPLPAGTALLVVKRGPNAGSRFLLDQNVTTCGRHHDSDIFLDDVTVSRRHAEFRRDGSTFIVTDVGSMSGTFVNRERIEAATLASGDEVQVGNFRLVYLTVPSLTSRPDGTRFVGTGSTSSARWRSQAHRERPRPGVLGRWAMGLPDVGFGWCHGDVRGA